MFYISYNSQNLYFQQLYKMHLTCYDPLSTSLVQLFSGSAISDCILHLVSRYKMEKNYRNIKML